MTTKDMDKKNGSVVGEKASTSMDGLNSELLGKIREMGILEEVSKVFKEKARDYLASHFTIGISGKVRVAMISGEYRKYIDGLEIKDIKFYPNRVCLVNNFVLVRIVNAEILQEKKITSGVILRKMANGSFRAIGMGRQNITIEL
jgi:hypothetical protein